MSTSVQRIPAIEAIQSTDTGWRCFAGQCDTREGFQILPDLTKPILWRGGCPPTDADAHVYAIHEAPGCLLLRLHAKKQGLKWGGLDVGAPDIEICWDHMQLTKNLRLHMKLKL